MKTLSLNVPKPCSEKWASFSPTTTGGFCMSCSKVVTDFTAMTDEQIISFLGKSSQHVCGRFRPDQLKPFASPSSSNIHPGFTLLRAGVIGLFVLLMNTPGNARMVYERSKSEIVSSQNESALDSSVNGASVVTGAVRDKIDNLPLPGVNVYLKGGSEGTVTDADGRFELHVDVRPGDILVFSYIGYETQEYKISKVADEVLEINIDLHMDVTVLGELVVDDVYQESHSRVKDLWSKVKAWF